jgi:UPF0271 protein
MNVDLVADLGEGFGQYRMGDDEAMLNLVSSANIACGFHAGDPRIMDATVARCKELGVGVGAHPSFPDLVGFGRRSMDLSANEVETDVIYQIGALQAFTQAHKTRLQHVSPHGRLGNLVVIDRKYAEAVVRAIQRVDDSLIVLTMQGVLVECAKENGLQYGVFFAGDRAYEDDGTLVSRKRDGAVIDDSDKVAERVVRMVTERVVRTISGKDIPIECDSILLHGDSKGAVSSAQNVRNALKKAGVHIRGLDEVVAARSLT